MASCVGREAGHLTYRTFRTALALSLALLAAPVAAWGPTYHADGLLRGPSTFASSTSHGWNIPLDAGDTLVVSLDWFDPMADLDAFVIQPAGSCSVNLNNVNCIANPNRVNCADIPRGGPVGDLDGHESFAWTALVSGVHELFVGGAIVGPFDVPYHLTVEVWGGGSTYDITRGRDANFVTNHCRLLLGANLP